MLREETKQAPNRDGNSNNANIPQEGSIIMDEDQKGRPFESVFDTLRILESKDGDKGGIMFKWVEKKIRKQALFNKRSNLCEQCKANPEPMAVLSCDNIPEPKLEVGQGVAERLS
jgi:hypothetical protein